MPGIMIELRMLDQIAVRLLQADEEDRYAFEIVQATRGKEEGSMEYCQRYLSFGAGPQANLNLILTAKVHAIIHGQMCVGCATLARSEE